LFLLPHTDALSRSSTTSARLYFLSGPRLIAYLTSTHSLLSNTATILSCGAPQVPDRVAQVVDERKRAEKRVDDLGFELAGLIAEQLATEMNKGGDNGVFKKHLSRTDDTVNPLGFLSTISFAVSNAEAFEKRPHIIILTSSTSLQMASSTTVVLVFGSDEKMVKAAGEGLKARVGVKGGGKGTKWSGKFIGVWKRDEREQDLEDLLNRL
jgi:misacylated tRNA(Ala) deacylase